MRSLNWNEPCPFGKPWQDNLKPAASNLYLPASTPGHEVVLKCVCCPYASYITLYTRYITCLNQEMNHGGVAELASMHGKLRLRFSMTAAFSRKPRSALKSAPRRAGFARSVATPLLATDGFSCSLVSCKLQSACCLNVLFALCVLGSLSPL